MHRLDLRVVCGHKHKMDQAAVAFNKLEKGDVIVAVHVGSKRVLTVLPPIQCSAYLLL